MVEQRIGQSSTWKEHLIRRVVCKRFISRLRDFISSPQKLFVLIGLVFGLLMLCLNPPFQVIDEQHHFFKTFRLSEGVITADAVGGSTGTDVPQSVLTTLEEIKFMKVVDNAKQEIGDVSKSFEIPLLSSEQRFLKNWKLTYTPFLYLPQIFGFWTGRIFHMSPIALLYLGRLFNLLTWLLLCYFAIRITPVHKWVFFLLALMPMTINLTASLSADSITIAIAFLAIAYFLKLALDEGKEQLDRRDIYYLLLVAFFLAVSKQPYFLLVFLFFMIPWRKFGSIKRYLLTFAIMFLVILVVLGAWSIIASSSLGQGPFPNVAPGKQLRYIATHPQNYAVVILRTFDYFKEDYMGGVTCTLGLYKSSLPLWLYYTYFFALVFVAAIDKDEKKTLSGFQRGCSAGIFILVAIAILTLFYVDWTPLREPMIWGVQGRYFIPIAPLFFLIFYNQKIRFKKDAFFYISITAFSLLTSGLMIFKLIQSYY